MANLRQSIRGKLPSKRAMLTVGGAAALVAAGIVQTTGTMAATTDGASANVEHIASQNFFPVYAPVSPGYSTPGTCFGGNATMNWQPASGTPSDQKWQIEEWGDGGTTLMWTSSLLPATDRSRQTGMESGGGSTHEYRIYGVNATTSERSTGYSSVYFWRDGGRCSYSKGTSVGGPVNISTWQETTNYTPGTASRTVGGENVSRFRVMPTPDKADQLDEASPSSSQAPSSSATPSTSEAPSTSESPSTSEAPSTSESPSTSEAPSSTTSSPSKTPSASVEAPAPTAEAEPKVTVAIEETGVARKLIVFVDGKAKCTIPLEKDEKPNVGSGAVTITNGGAVKTVDLDTCTAS